LSRRGLLPFVRVQPLTFQGSLQAVWSPLLEQFSEPPEVFAAGAVAAASQVQFHV